MLSVLRSTDSDYPFGIFWPLCCLFFDLRVADYPFGIFWSLCCLFFDLRVADYPFGIFWPLCCLFFDQRMLIAPLVSFGHCVVCSSIYGCWLPLWYLLAIVLSVLRSTNADYPFGIFRSLCCLFFDLRVADYPFGISWPLCCLFFDLLMLITPLVSFGHCVVCSYIYGRWLPLWYLLAIVLSVLLSTNADYLFGIFWPLCCLFFYLRMLITPLVSFGHCVVCSSIYGCWLPLWYLMAIVLSVLRSTDSDYPFGIFRPLCCLFFDLRMLITFLWYLQTLLSLLLILIIICSINRLSWHEMYFLGIVN